MAAEHPTDVQGELFVPVVCLVVQGVKDVRLGARSVRFSAGTFVVSALDHPITGHIVDAPYRAVAVHLTASTVADLMLADHGPVEVGDVVGFGTGRASAELVDAMVRLLRLLEDERDRAVLGGAAEREVVSRAIQSPNGAIIRRFARAGHLVSRVQPAIVWIREHLAERLSVEELTSQAT